MTTFYGHRDGFITYNDKIYVPKSQRNQILSCHHDMLCHPGTNRMMQTTQHCSSWPSLVADTKLFVATCRNYQLGKKLLPMSDSTLKPWQTLCVDCIDPYTITDVTGKEYILKSANNGRPSVGTIRDFRTPHQMSTQNSYITGSYMSLSSPKTNANHLRQLKRVSE